MSKTLFEHETYDYWVEKTKGMPLSNQSNPQHLVFETNTQFIVRSPVAFFIKEKNYETWAACNNHRTDGPAVIYKNGIPERSYWIHGEHISLYLWIEHPSVVPVLNKIDLKKKINNL